MPRKESEAVPEGKGPIPLYVLPGGLSLEDLQRIWWETWDEVCKENGLKKLEKSWEMRATDQRVASLEQDARQPRLDMEVDGPENTKTRERAEGPATAVQAMHGDSFSACRVDPGPMTNSTSFGMMAKPPALPYRDDIVVESGDAAPKLCLPSLEMRTTTVAGGLLPTGKTSTATDTTFNEPLLQFYSTEEANCKKTSTPYVSHDSSVWNLLAASSCRRVIETRSGDNGTFDPGGSRGRLRACPFLGSWRALLCGEVMRAGAAG